jgi:hypothetical protein
MVWTLFLQHFFFLKSLLKERALRNTNNVFIELRLIELRLIELRLELTRCYV